ncbi:hypothetical protein JJB52_08715 [Clostridium perfringens]|uniref:hypothetical protein n=1 Tax=Clostridium perfringens TaxID=1502 RepID=UPI001ABA3749|nr:hypothetical protein [Clostridium perfringens]MBO3344347.1 hypothetical protein [Clostridium perfringens]MBO3347032.1 hypothetical protein [Clostridium perfringens]MBO3350088.1 hypothetical protein [Clostridium perfringens]MBO3370744.1 hypothetical protein [Clostridium perfringens]
MKLTVNELHRLSILIEKINISKANHPNPNEVLPLLDNNFIISFNNSLWACQGLRFNSLTIPSINMYKLDKNIEGKIVINSTEIILNDFFQKMKNSKIFDSNHYKFLSTNELPYFLNDFYEIIKDGSIFAEELKLNLPVCLFYAMNLNDHLTFSHLVLDKNTSYELISIVSSLEFN